MAESQVGAMAFIRVQNLKRDGDGRVRSGSASVIDVAYDPDAKSGHSRQKVRESLGRVLWLSEDRRSGVFLSKTRGLVAYDAGADAFSAVAPDDGRIAGCAPAIPTAEAHVVFGDAYLLLRILEKSGLLGCIRHAFPEDAGYARVLAHICHSVCRDGSRISCEDFCGRSALGHVLPGLPLASLRSDTAYFGMMGADSAKVAFFRELCRTMRGADPGFGRGCYVDSTPLPNDVADNPFNALCSHGVGGAAVMERMAMVLDAASGIPLWYELICGNVLDVSTVDQIREDARQTCGVEVSSLVLDSGYCSRRLLELCHVGTQTECVVRMPARRGYPYRTLWCDLKGQMGRGKYAFARAGHAYFGKRADRDVQGFPEHLYVYVDKNNAASALRDTLAERPEEYEAMLARDKDFEQVRGGYFVLVSNIEDTPAGMLDRYFGRVDIEQSFKASKEYIGLLPLSKWTDLTVRGKILSDMTASIALSQVRAAIAGAQIRASATSLWGKSSSLMCRRQGDDLIVGTPSKKVREWWHALGVEVPSKVGLAAFRSELGFRE